MTRTLDLSPELENQLNEVADGAGVPTERLLLDAVARGLEEMRADAALDAEDVETARRVLAEGDLSNCGTLDDLRKAIGR